MQAQRHLPARRRLAQGHIHLWIPVALLPGASGGRWRWHHHAGAPDDALDLFHLEDAGSTTPASGR